MAVSTELHQQLLHVFQLCDEENTGCVSVHQIEQLGRQHYLNDKELGDLVDLLDPGGNGAVSFEDFCKGVSTIMQMQGGDSSVGEPLRYVDKTLGQDEDMREFDRLSPGRRSIRGAPGESARGLRPPKDPKSLVDSGPPSLDLPMGAASPAKTDNGVSICSSMSDREENFECYGEGDELECEPTQPHSLDYGLAHRSPQASGNFIRRNSWLRTSLRRSPTTNRRHPVTAPNCGGSLHRSSSFTSSGRGSAGDVEDRYSDNSLEDDVMDLSQKVQMLQQQVTALAETQSSTDDRYSRVRQENAGLQARIQMLEEQLREAEGRGDVRLQDEQRRNREIVLRVEREKQLENENMAIKLRAAESHSRTLEEEVMRLKTTSERLRVERESMSDQLSDAQYQLSSMREEVRRMEELNRREKEQLQRESALNGQLMEELSREVEVLRKQSENHDGRDSPDGGDGLAQQYHKLEQELQVIRKENQGLKENNEELHAQLLTTSLEEGRHLVSSHPSNSLAAEFEQMGQNELKQKLIEQQECNAQLRSYIDGILLNIVENYPQLLEVKTPK